jgi:hypothetical protein
MATRFSLPRWLDHIGMPLVLAGSIVVMLSTVA